MEILNGVEMLEIQIESFGGRQKLHPTLIWDNSTAVLIDTGTPGQLQQIRNAMNDAGVPFEKLKAIILTHQDIDHIGSLPEILKESDSQIEVYAHEADKPYIEGRFPLAKANLESMAWQLEGLSEDIRKEIVANVNNSPRGRVDKTLFGGEELPFCGGIQVVFTPGHTPGHISLYLNRSKTLVAGDSMYSVEGVLHGPHSPSTPDMDTAYHSITKYLDFDIENVICYHGGLSKDNVKTRLKNIIDKSNRSNRPLLNGGDERT